jgi:ATP-dependent helicase HrpA
VPRPKQQSSSRRPSARHDAIHRALLTGLLSNIGQRSEQHEYAAPRGTKFSIFPGSALFKANPSWVMAAELVETTKLYARTVATIRPEWIERAAVHLIKRTYSEPHWHGPSAHVVAYEKLMLRGLVIVPRRTVHYGPIEPRTSREIFIHHALVEGDYKTSADSILRNRELLDQVLLLQAKARRDDLLTDPAHRFAFYHARIPADVYDGPRFEQWRREIEKTEPTLLHMQPTDVINEKGAQVTESLYPDSIHVGAMQIALDYRFEPGHSEDGITSIIPLPALNQLPAEPFEWLVPGQLPEKIDFLIRSLPKALRVLFVPVPEHVQRASAVLLSTEFPPAVSLRRALADHLGKIAGVTITMRDFSLDDMPAHLRMNFRVQDSGGNVVSMGRDLAAIRQFLGVRAKAVFATLPSSQWNRDQLTRWDFGDIPRHVEIRHAGLTLTGYPALLDRGTSVSLRLFDSPEAAAASMRTGIVRLFMVQLHKEVEYLQDSIPNIEQLSLYYAPLGSSDQLREQIVRAAADRALFEDGPYVRTRLQFIERAESGWRHLSAAAGEIQAIVIPALRSFHELSLELSKAAPPLLRESFEDMRAHLARLIHADFLTATPFAMLVHIPRFLAGIQWRLKKLLAAGALRDLQQSGDIRIAEQRYEKRLAKLRADGIIDPRMEQFRWMLEEFRVSLFAQELKTSMPISAKRLETYWQTLDQ